MDKPSRLSLLGAEVDVISPVDVMDFVSQKVAAKERAIVANHNLHSLYLFQRRADMRAFYEKADLIEIDPTPMIAWAKLMGHKISRAHRCTYLDFREEFWSLAQVNGWRVYHIGGEAAHNAASKAAILSRYPAAHLDLHTGFFDINGPGNTLLLADLREKKPDVLLVGMGMPRQETWILSNLDRLPHCVILPVGAAFDYEAGVMYTPPRWTGQVGIEWLVRFCNEPQRLFERYFVEPWWLVPQAFRDVWRRQKSDVSAQTEERIANHG